MRRARCCSISGAAPGTRSLCELFGVPMALLPEVRDCAGDFGVTDRSVRRRDPHPRHRRRSAGGDDRAGLLCARHDEIDLRHRLLRVAQHRRGAGCVAQPPAHHHRLSARPASAPTRWKARSSSPAPRCSGCATALHLIGKAPDVNALAAQADPAEQVYLVPAFVGLGAPYWDARGARRDLRPDAQFRRRRARARGAGGGRLPDPRPARSHARRLAGRPTTRCCGSTAA